MREKSPIDFFDDEIASAYDERNNNLSPIKDALYFSMNLVLKELPDNSRILCVGAGTGTEIISLSKEFPKWTFVAVEPSESMLSVCKKKVEHAGITHKCDFIHGYVEDIPPQENYDAIISLFVGHFLDRGQRISFFQNLNCRLRSGGYLVHSEISFDLNSKQFPLMLQKWREVQKLLGSTKESLEKLPNQLKNILTVLPPDETEEQIKKAGLDCPIRFFQALMICGWFVKKD